MKCASIDTLFLIKILVFQFQLAACSSYNLDRTEASFDEKVKSKTGEGWILVNSKLPNFPKTNALNIWLWGNQSSPIKGGTSSDEVDTIDFIQFDDGDEAKSDDNNVTKNISRGEKPAKQELEIIPHPHTTKSNNPSNAFQKTGFEPKKRNFSIGSLLENSEVDEDQDDGYLEEEEEEEYDNTRRATKVTEDDSFEQQQPDLAVSVGIASEASEDDKDYYSNHDEMGEEEDFIEKDANGKDDRLEQSNDTNTISYEQIDIETNDEDDSDLDVISIKRLDGENQQKVFSAALPASAMTNPTQVTKASPSCLTRLATRLCGPSPTYVQGL